jgi:hypothetical protein
MNFFSDEEGIINTFKNRGKTNKERRANINSEENTINVNLDEDGNTIILNKPRSFISKSFGKATTYFNEAAKSSPTLQLVMQNMSYSSLSTLTQAVKGLKTESFGLSFARLRGSYQYEFEKAIQNLDRVGGFFFKNIDPVQNKQLVSLLNNSALKLVDGVPISKEVREAAKKIKKLMNRVHKDMSSSNKTGRKIDKPEIMGWDGKPLEFDAVIEGRQKIKDYFPHRIQNDYLTKNRSLMVNLLKKYGYTSSETGEVVPYAQIRNEIDPKYKVEYQNEFGEIHTGFKTSELSIDMEVFGVDFEKLAKKELIDDGSKKFKSDYTLKELTSIRDRAEDIKANRIIKDMLDLKDDPFGSWNLDIDKPTTGSRTGFLKERVFSHIPPEEMQKFIDTDVENVINE